MVKNLYRLVSVEVAEESLSMIAVLQGPHYNGQEQ